MCRSLRHSEFITIDPSADQDFNDWDTFLNHFYATFTGKIKKNHIFHVSHDNMRKGNQIEVELRESNLPDDKISLHRAVKKDFFTQKNYPKNAKGLREAVTNRPTDIKTSQEKLLRRLEPPGTNIYKQVEMFKNYRPLVPVEFQDDLMYAEPAEDIKVAVKEEKEARKRSRDKINEKKWRVKNGH